MARRRLELLRAADDAARHLAQVGLARGEQPDRRPAEGRRAREVTPLAGDDVGAGVARCAQQAEREGVGNRDEERPRRVRGLGQRFEVGDGAEEVGLLGDEAGVLLGRRVPGGDEVDTQARAAGVGAHHIDRAGVDRFEQRDGGAARRAGGQQARLGGRAGHVVEAGVGDVHAGQLTDDRLVLKADCSVPWLISGWYGVYAVTNSDRLVR